jgi:hypothetical protein
MQRLREVYGNNLGMAAMHTRRFIRSVSRRAGRLAAAPFRQVDGGRGNVLSSQRRGAPLNSAHMTSDHSHLERGIFPKIRQIVPRETLAAICCYGPTVK